MANPSYIPFGRRVINAGGLLNQKHKLNGIRVINKTGSDIAVDKLVAVVGYDTTAELPKIVLADADVNTHTDVYVTLRAIGNGDEGFVFKGGLSAADLNTNSASAAGDPVYLSTTAGGFTHTAPSGADDKVLPVGWVVTKSASVGEIHWHIGEAEKLGEDIMQSGMTINAPVGTEATEVVTAANTITAAESGTTFFLNSATEFASTLPAPAAGLFYRFIVTAAPSSASYTVATESAAQILAGQVHSSTGGDADSETAATGTTITFVDGSSVIGDWVEVISDGTSWFAQCFCDADGGITITG